MSIGEKQKDAFLFEDKEMEPMDYIFDYLQRVLLERELKLVVFGAGMVGTWLLSVLAAKKHPVYGFSDNNSSFIDTQLFGIPFRPVEELKVEPEKYFFIVTPMENQEIVYQLKALGFSHVDVNIMRALKFLPSNMADGLWGKMHPLGHFYSLYPDVEEIFSRADEVFNRSDSCRDVNLNEDKQLKMQGIFQTFYNDLPSWSESEGETSTGLRYRISNPSFPLGDAVGLHCMLRNLCPKRLIEVGSGFSSAVSLDTNEYYLNGSMEMTFIEPYPRVLNSILKQSDQIRLINSGLQQVPIAEFQRLEEGDVLFIDSTHVSKIDSDVNYLFFEIFPNLKPGVYIHLHDICYPFTYPREWIYGGMIWNEVYLLRAFLQNNQQYEVIYHQDMLNKKFPELFLHNWPYDVSSSGGSFWMKKL